MSVMKSGDFPRDRSPDRRWAALAIGLVAILAAFRLIALFLTPLELYPDEAQYWAWSRTLSWGYFSKPPMIAWLIAASTALGGDVEAWVRLPAWVCQTAAAGFVFLAARRLWDARVGFWAAALYTLAPGVGLSSGVASTDAPLLLFLSAALWAYACFLQGGGLRSVLGLGIALGLAVLSKYAALYVVGALVLHALSSREARRSWTTVRLGAAVTALAACVAPNLIWNATHGFETVAHTASNANWNAGDLVNPGEALSFLGAQFGVFGPIAFAILLVAMFDWARRRRNLDAGEGAVLLLALVPLTLVLVQAFLSRANANWAAAFIPPGAVLAAASALAWRPGPALLVAAAVTQAAVQFGMAAALVWPEAASVMQLDNGLKRARGWTETARVVEAEVAAAQGSTPLAAVAVDSRLLFYELTYYGRGWLALPGAPPLTAWVREPSPQNEAEASSPLTTASGGRVLAVSATPDYRSEFQAAFGRASPGGIVRVPLDRARTRDLFVFVGEGYLGRPVSARPTRP